MKKPTKPSLKTTLKQAESRLRRIAENLSKAYRDGSKQPRIQHIQLQLNHQAKLVNTLKEKLANQ